MSVYGAWTSYEDENPDARPHTVLLSSLDVDVPPLKNFKNLRTPRNRNPQMSFIGYPGGVVRYLAMVSANDGSYILFVDVNGNIGCAEDCTFMICMSGYNNNSLCTSMGYQKLKTEQLDFGNLGW